MRVIKLLFILFFFLFPLSLHCVGVWVTRNPSASGWFLQRWRAYHNMTKKRCKYGYQILRVGTELYMKYLWGVGCFKLMARDFAIVHTYIHR